MKIFVDIDNTVFKTEGTDYKNSTPIMERIYRINQLKREGNEIYYYTARGSVSGIDYYELTKKQLDSCGAEYDELIMGKPAFDLLIDDRAINSKTFFELNNCKDNQ